MVKKAKVTSRSGRLMPLVVTLRPSKGCPVGWVCTSGTYLAGDLCRGGANCVVGRCSRSRVFEQGGKTNPRPASGLLAGASKGGSNLVRGGEFLAVPLRQAEFLIV